MSIRGHALVYFEAPVVTTLGRTASFDLVLASVVLIGVVRQGSLSSRKVYTRPLERLEYAH